MKDRPNDPTPTDDEPPEEEEKERKKCKQCRRAHSGPTPFCPGGPYY